MHFLKEEICIIFWKTLLKDINHLNLNTSVCGDVIGEHLVLKFCTFLARMVFNYLWRDPLWKFKGVPFWNNKLLSLTYLSRFTGPASRLYSWNFRSSIKITWFLIWRDSWVLQLVCGDAARFWRMYWDSSDLLWTLIGLFTSSMETYCALSSSMGTILAYLRLFRSSMGTHWPFIGPSARLLRLIESAACPWRLAG